MSWPPTRPRSGPDSNCGRHFPLPNSRATCRPTRRRCSGRHRRPRPRTRTLYPSRRTLGTDTSSQPGRQLASKNATGQNFRNWQLRISGAHNWTQNSLEAQRAHLPGRSSNRVLLVDPCCLRSFLSRDSASLAASRGLPRPPGLGLTFKRNIFYPINHRK